MSKPIAELKHDTKLDSEILMVAPLTNTGHILTDNITKQNIQMYVISSNVYPGQQKRLYFHLISKH